MLRALFRLLRIVGDAKAVGRGPGAVGKRMVRRRAHRGVRRLFR